MKINEITGAFKVMRSTPQEVQLQSPTDKTTITTTPAAFSQNPKDPTSMVLNLGNSQQVAPGQPATQPTAQGTPAQPATQPTAQGIPAQPATQPTAQGIPAQPATQPTAQASPGQQSDAQATQPTAQATPLPQVGSEVELPDDIGSTVQSETFDNSDLVKNGNKPIGGRKGGDKTADFIDDVTDDEENTSGRNKRTFVKPEPIRESEELIAMLTIAGLR